MRIWHAPVTGETGLDASAAELRALAGMLDSGSGDLHADGVHRPAPAPPGLPLLTAIEVRALPDRTLPVAVRARPDRDVLRIEGGREGLAVLAENLRGIADTPDSGHQHIEYFPDHFYLAADSEPLVVAGPNGG